MSLLDRTTRDRRTVKTLIHLVAAVSLAVSVRGEMRSWTSLSGKTIEAEYVKKIFDDVILRDAGGAELRIPIAELSAEDVKYIELANPPELTVDFMKSENQDFIQQTPFNTGGAVPLPPTLLKYKFGGRVKQREAHDYPYPLTLEIYAFTQQRYDPSKYHLIARIKSKPFVLSKENGQRHEFMDKKAHRVFKYELYVDYLSWNESRGEKFAESLLLVRDERGEIIAYNTTKNWLYNNLDKLEALPVGAWLDKTCQRVHPTSPKPTKKPGSSFL